MQLSKLLNVLGYKGFFIAFVLILRVSTWLVYFMSRRRAISKAKHNNLRLAIQKRQKRRLALQKIQLPPLHPEAHNAFLHKSIPQIQRDFRTRAYTSVDLVVQAIRRTMEIGVRRNYVSDINFEEALKMAQECDREREIEDKQLAPLHGIPVSIKDQIYLKGSYSNWCHSSHSNPVQEDSSLITILKQAGAIPFVKSTTPLTSSLHTSNFAWGEVKHPKHPNRIIGGSSGGQAGLLQSRCSILGVGTDTAGSLRIPAAFNGLVTIYPTTKRMPCGKTGGDMGPDCKVAAQLIKSTPGPMARRVADLECFLQTVMSKEAYTTA